MTVERFAVIAIDGGAGTGKTTSAARVAERLGFCYVDSGAIYRTVAWALHQAGVSGIDDPGFSDRLASLDLEIRPAPDRFRIFLGGREATANIRTPEVSALSSKIAVRPDVRDRVTALLRQAGGSGPLVVEGRDIGTVVFPDARLKVFLTAELPVRAERRHGDLARQGIDQPRDQVLRELDERDRRDSSRDAAPLRQAPDALLIDTGRTTIEEQVEAIVHAWLERSAQV
ncbi:MAG: (d)CMP kinase [Candidatus Eisenbacteria bacterium]|nr:(d)CMP kinase [Candidatus Eisenbacteria bacterium]